MRIPAPPKFSDGDGDGSMSVIAACCSFVNYHGKGKSNEILAKLLCVIFLDLGLKS